jgi:hypothetical protein
MADHAAVAAAANASWCDVVCRSLGFRTHWQADAWTAAERTPDGYPDAVTLSRGADPVALLTRVDGGSGCSVKDSFADLDLAPLGFSVLFEATWIRRPAYDVAMPVALDWHEVHSPAELRDWSQGHDLDVFVPALLEVDGLGFFQEARANAGFALHRTRDVVGVSNTIADPADLTTVWSDTVAIAGQLFPGRDLVGYEIGADLEAALTVGFVQTGPLRVWIR